MACRKPLSLSAPLVASMLHLPILPYSFINQEETVFHEALLEKFIFSSIFAAI